MNLTNAIHATGKSVKELIANHPKDEPVVMLNILRFRDKTEAGTESGEQAYARYGANAFPFLKKAGAKILWRGKVTNMVIGEGEKPPHEILLVKYPTVQHFLDMALSEEYMKIAHDRTIALEYGGLISAQIILQSL
jgi:uncharacterized protein (DUF1330 family)